jgi:hypothetical protein
MVESKRFDDGAAIETRATGEPEFMPSPALSGSALGQDAV